MLPTGTKRVLQPQHTTRATWRTFSPSLWLTGTKGKTFSPALPVPVDTTETKIRYQPGLYALFLLVFYYQIYIHGIQKMWYFLQTFCENLLKQEDHWLRSIDTSAVPGSRPQLYCLWVALFVLERNPSKAAMLACLCCRTRRARRERNACTYYFMAEEWWKCFWRTLCYF
jgi:hypothetical protein